MNERTMRDRLHALGPLVLRVGIALVLLHDGLGRAAGMFDRSAATAMDIDRPAVMQAAALATPEGVRFSADWGSLLGLGELAASGLLFVGLLTRLVTLPILGVLGYGLTAGFPQTSMPANTGAMLLLGAACLSLLVSGGGCLALRRPRRRAYVAETPLAHKKYADTTEYEDDRPRRTPRLRNWFGWWRKRRPAMQPVMSPAKRWPWTRR
jgi:uncharacterized membrane protein YphA (DoxX/SURF4 family)